MGAAVLLLIIFTLSAMVIKVGATALRLTGLPVVVARFQARSAFSGAGFTTSESESVINHPVRRQVINYLIMFGNLGLVSVLATVIVSFVSMERDANNLIVQLLLFIGVFIVLWFVVLNPVADRIICGVIAALLKKYMPLGKRSSTVLLELSPKFSVTQHLVTPESRLKAKTLGEIASLSGRVLGVRRQNGEFLANPPLDTHFFEGDAVIVFGASWPEAAEKPP